MVPKGRNPIFWLLLSCEWRSLLVAFLIDDPDEGLIVHVSQMLLSSDLLNVEGRMQRLRRPSKILQQRLQLIVGDLSGEVLCFASGRLMLLF